MAKNKKKAFKLNFNNNKHLTALLFVTAFAAVGATMLFSSYAAPRTPTGSMVIAPESNLVYGGKVKFDASVDWGNVKKGIVYVTMVCRTVNGAVAHISAFNTYEFNLVGSSTQNLAKWEPTEEASCIANLIYNNDAKRNTVIETLDSVSFDVLPQ